MICLAKERIEVDEESIMGTLNGMTKVELGNLPTYYIDV